MTDQTTTGPPAGADDVAPDPVTLPEMRRLPYVRPPMHEQTFVPPRW